MSDDPLATRALTDWCGDAGHPPSMAVEDVDGLINYCPCHAVAYAIGGEA